MRNPTRKVHKSHDLSWVYLMLVFFFPPDY